MYCSISDGPISDVVLLFVANEPLSPRLSGESRPRRYGASGRRQEFAFVNFNVTAGTLTNLYRRTSITLEVNLWLHIMIPSAIS